MSSSVCTCISVCISRWYIKHTKRNICLESHFYLFVSLLLTSSVTLLMDRWAAWSDDAAHQRQPMWLAIRLSCSSSLIPAIRPCLYVKAVMPVVLHSSRALCCVCGFMQEFVCTCVLLPWQIYSNHSLSASIGGDGGVVGEGGGPFESLPSFPSLQPPSAHCSTAQLTSSSRQTEWIKEDTMRHLMQQSRSPTASLLLCAALPSNSGSEESKHI